MTPKQPVDFEQKSKVAPSPNGTGYPYRLSARDLMSNFVFSAIEVSDAPHSSGLSLKETQVVGEGGHMGRMIELDGTLSASASMPAGSSEGDMLYWSGGTEPTWEIIPASTFLATNEEFGVLTEQDGFPSWKKGKEIEFYCWNAGAVGTIKLFANEEFTPL